MVRLAIKTLLAAVFVAGLHTQAAEAAWRWAAPDGPDFGECTQSVPCSLEHAVKQANASKDDVRLPPGDYQLKNPLKADGIEIKATGVDESAAQPVIRAPNGASYGVEIIGGTLEGVRLRGHGTSNGVLRVDNSWVERTTVIATGDNAEAIIAWGGTGLEDCVAAMYGTGVAAILSVQGNTDLTAVTTWSDGRPGVAAHGWTTVKIANSVLLSTPFLATDISAKGLGALTPATVTVKDGFMNAYDEVSNASVTLGAHVSSAEPVLVNPAGEDFRQAAASPTVDYLDLSSSKFDRDFRSDLRKVGTKVDAGADELPAPPQAVTGPVGALTPTTATVSGAVLTGGGLTGYHFDWGTTTAYLGSAVPDRLLSAQVPILDGAKRTLTGLRPATTYHYRVVADNSRVGAVAHGADATFTTPPSPTKPGGPTGPGKPAGPGGSTGQGGRGKPPARVRVKGLRVSPRRFRAWASRRMARRRAAAGAARRRRARVPVGARIRFALSRKATVRLKVERKTVGRRRGKRCLASRRPVRLARRSRCTRWKGAGVWRHAGRAGLTGLRFKGWIGKRKLVAGSYRLTVVAGAGATRSVAKRYGFAVLR